MTDRNYGEMNNGALDVTRPNAAHFANRCLLYTSQFSHLVHFVHVLACQEVQSVEIRFIRRYLQGVLCLLHGDDKMCIRDRY